MLLENKESVNDEQKNMKGKTGNKASKQHREIRITQYV